MSLKAITGLAVLVMSLSTFAQAGAADDAIEQSALEFQSERFAAMVDMDIDLLEVILADDLSYAHSTGRVETKQEFLQTLESGVLDYQVIAPQDVQVRMYGDIAVMTGVAEVEVVFSGEAIGITMRFLDVSRRVGDGWQLVAWQSTTVPDNQ